MVHITRFLVHLITYSIIYALSIHRSILSTNYVFIWTLKPWTYETPTSRNSTSMLLYSYSTTSNTLVAMCSNVRRTSGKDLPSQFVRLTRLDIRSDLSVGHEGWERCCQTVERKALQMDGKHVQNTKERKGQVSQVGISNTEDSSQPRVGFFNELSGISHAKLLLSSLLGSYSFLFLSFPFCYSFPYITSSVLLFLLIILPLTRRNCMWSVYFKILDYTSILKNSKFLLCIMQIIYANAGLEKPKWYSTANGGHPWGRDVGYGRRTFSHFSLHFYYKSLKTSLSFFFYSNHILLCIRRNEGIFLEYVGTWVIFVHMIWCRNFSRCHRRNPMRARPI